MNTDRCSRPPVPIDVRAWRAWPWLRGVAYAEKGTTLVGPDGTTLRVREDGGLDPWPPAGHRSIASDPTASSCSESSLSRPGASERRVTLGKDHP